MFKLELYYLINEYWVNDGDSIRDRVPEEDDLFYYERKKHIVKEVREDDEHPLVFHVFLERVE